MPPKRDVVCVCLHCHKEFSKKPSEIRKGEGKYCSRECTFDARRAREALTVKRVEKCAFCGKEFVARLKTSKYCSHSCQQKGSAEVRRMRDSKACEICGTVFYPRNSTQKFCSTACRGVSHQRRSDKVCLICGATFPLTPALTREHNFCSVKCLSKWKETSMKGNLHALGMTHSEETKKQISETLLYKMRTDEEFAKSRFAALNIKYNKLEQLFNENTPDSVVYQGDGKFFLTFKDGRIKNPDFVVAHQRKVIELFGDYWHRGEDPEELIKQYNEIGFECLVLWEHEVKKDLENSIARTLAFVS